MTSKRAAFVQEYLVDMNSAQAAIRAGYSEHTARTIGSELLTFPDVQDAITKAQAERSKRTKVTAERIVEEYRRIAFADLRDVIQIKDGKVTVNDTDSLTAEQAAALSEIAETKDGIRVKLNSKQAALDSLSKHLGMFVERAQVEVTDKAPREVRITLVEPPGAVESSDTETSPSPQETDST